MRFLGARIAGLGVGIAMLAAALSIGGARAQEPETYTSPIDITGGKISIEAVAPDKTTGIKGPVPLDIGTGFAALSGAPVNVLFDGRWNGTTEQQAAGTSPRQQSCDGPGGIKELIAAKAAAKGRTAFDITCNFATAGSVFVQQSPRGLLVSYQLFDNRGSFKIKSDPADARFSLKFTLELTVLLHTRGTICELSANAPVVRLQAVQIAPENAAASVHAFLNPSDLTEMELSAQAKERTTSISINDAFQQLRDKCNQGDIISKVIAKFTQLETDITLPKGVTLRATHPAIAAPRFSNIDLPSGQYTCVAGYVWRNAFDHDVVCVTPQRMSQTRDENSHAAERREPNGGAWGEATCRAGFVWRAARPDDLVCVLPASRDLVAEENESAASRWVAGEVTPSLLRPLITAPPVVAAGGSFQLTGQFFPPIVDPTRLQLRIERDATAVCIGGRSELETTSSGTVAANAMPPSGNMSSCAYSYLVVGLKPATHYGFRVRDCDFITCSPWSAPFETTTLAADNGPAPVSIALDGTTPLDSAAPDSTGKFQLSVQVPADTPPGIHKLSAFTGDRGDTAEIRVTPAGGETATLTVTISFFGEDGCPMHELDPPKIAAQEPFPLFGSGFAPGKVKIYLDRKGGLNLGSATVKPDGTFCNTFRAIPLESLGNHDLVAVQEDAERAVFPVEVVYVPSVH